MNSNKSSLSFLQLMECANEYITKEKYKCQSPSDIAKLMYPITKDSTQEVLYSLTLNARNRLIEMNLISIGTVNACNLHAREIFRKAIIDNASRIVLVHNHPSGDPTPSPQDVEFTRSVVSAGKIIGIEIMDHVILGHYIEGTNNKNHYSMREANRI